MYILQNSKTGQYYMVCEWQYLVECNGSDCEPTSEVMANSFACMNEDLIVVEVPDESK